MDNTRVKIPASLNDEDVFLSWGPVRMSMRQVVTILAGLFGWIGIAKYFVMPLLGFSLIFSMVACAWLPILAIAFAFVKVRQRPLENWLGDKISFHWSARTFILSNANVENQTIQDSDLYSDRDIQALLGSFASKRY